MKPDSGFSPVGHRVIPRIDRVALSGHQAPVVCTDVLFKWNLEHAPIEIVASAKKIPGWKAVDGVAHQPVTDRTGVYKGAVDNEVKKITLVPYGFTKVRIVAFPVVK